MAKRGRPKKKTFQQLLRERMQQSFEEAVEKQRPKPVKEPRKDSDDPFERRDAIAIEKRHAREKRYRNTTAGKESQKRRVQRYNAKPENKAKKKKYRKQWYWDNRDRELEKVRIYHATHKEQRRIY